MKKIIKTLILSFLVLTTAMTTAYTNWASAEVVFTPGTSEPGTHIFIAPEVEDERYILKNGEFLYTVVIPENANPREIVAKDEFVLLLKRATGNVAPVISDKNITEHNPDQLYISIGKTKLLDYAGIQINTEAIKSNGVRIITKDNTIFLAGGVADGPLNAVYDFFSICFDFEWYARNNLYINDTIKDLKLRDFDVTDVPDMNSHQITYGPMSKTTDTLSKYDKIALRSDNLTDTDLIADINNKSLRSRYQKAGVSRLMTVEGKKVLGGKTSTYGSQHNVLNIFSKYVEGWEKEWWADSEKQICWTAHGDEGSYQRMIDFAINRVIGYMKTWPPHKYPEIDCVMFGLEDGGHSCHCAACEYRDEMDGGKSGASIRFVRQVMDGLREWMDRPENAQWRREDFNIVIFAYGDSGSAPCFKNEKGEWVLNEGLYEDMEEYRGRMLEDIYVWKAISSAPHIDATVDYEPMQLEFEDFKAWAAIAEATFTWNYAELFLDKTWFMDFLSRYNKNLLDFYYDCGVDHAITELCSTGDAVTRWGDLYYYLITKLSWDRTQSSTELISKFMKAQFGPAAETMENLYYAQKMHFQRTADDYYKATGSHYDIGYKGWKQEHYPYEVIKGFINRIEQAYIDIDSLKVTDPDMYLVYKDRIDVEGIAHYYSLIKLYGDTERPYTQAEKELYKSRAIDLVTRRTLPGGLNLNLFMSW